MWNRGHLRGRHLATVLTSFVDLKPLTPDALRYRSNSLQLDRQTMYVIVVVPT